MREMANDNQRERTPTLARRARVLAAALFLAVPCAARGEDPTTNEPITARFVPPAAQVTAVEGPAPELHSGLKEVSVAGSLVIPNSSAKDALGIVTGRFGWYASARDVVGVAATFFVYSRVTDLRAAAQYRRLLCRGDARFQPFAGASAGISLLSYYDWGGTQTRFMATGELGFRYFPSRRLAFEAALSLDYYARGAGTGFTHATSTVPTFGLTYVF